MRWTIARKVWTGFGMLLLILSLAGLLIDRGIRLITRGCEGDHRTGRAGQRRCL